MQNFEDLVPRNKIKYLIDKYVAYWNDNNWDVLA